MFQTVSTFFMFFFLKDLTLQFYITIDGHYLTKPINELFHQKDFLTVPFMTGINNHEGGFVLGKVSM